MKKVLHISTECYPAAKAGGMGDVVGALPIFLPEHGVEASVIIPKYKRAWFQNQKFKSVAKGSWKLGEELVHYEIQLLNNKSLAYPFYCMDIPGKFDREDIYLGEDGHGYADEAERYFAFQLCTLDWLTKSKTKFDLLHCHDHMTGLIPFFIKHCEVFKKLKNTPTLFTIHNGQYRGIFDWTIDRLFPSFEYKYRGLLDWDGQVNSLATAIKCAWAINTVSPSYMLEIMQDDDTLTPLYRSESKKCYGILNGIDADEWDSATDVYLDHHLTNHNWNSFKALNKSHLIKEYNLKSRRPLIGFIGRLAHQKGADILVDAIEYGLQKGLLFSTIILGSGDKALEEKILKLAIKYPDSVAPIIAYNEKLARAIYAGSDYLIMPSRFEPCGLNQLYAMRYATIPIVSWVGGLKDTVPDMDQDGNGIVAADIDVQGFAEAIDRAINLYKDKSKFKALKSKIATLDYSWSKSAADYAQLYDDLI